MDNRRFPGGGLPRDTALDLDGKAKVGGPHPYGNQFRHDEDSGVDKPIGTDPNAAGGSTVFPDWWTDGAS